MWALARDSGALDLNTPYFYLTIADRFADTSVIARSGDRIVGFIAGLRPPKAHDTVFVWQITVAGEVRGRGIAHEMLRTLLERLAPQGVRYLDASVTPSNEASQQMFRRFAERLAAPCEESILYPAGLFPDGGHEPEHLLHIGPFDARMITSGKELVRQGETR